MVPQNDPQHCVTAGCCPLSLSGHMWPRGCSRTLCCSHLSCRGSQLLGQGGLIIHLLGFRLSSLRCSQCPVDPELGLSKVLCAFQTVGIQRHSLQGIHLLGQVVRKAG